MDLLPWLLFLHITAAVVYVGTDLLLTALLYRVRRDGAIAEFLNTVETASPIAGLAGALLLLSGIGMVLTVDAWGITSTFVLIGLTVIVVSAASEAIYFGRQAGKLRATIGIPAASAEPRAILGRLLVAAVILDILKLVAIWVMVFKPGA